MKTTTLESKDTKMQVPYPVCVYYNEVIPALYSNSIHTYNVLRP